MSCDAENIFESMEGFLKKLSDGATLATSEDKALRELLNEYWAFECPSDLICNRNTCNLARTNDWIAYHGYSSAAHLLKHFKYIGVKHLNFECFVEPSKPWVMRRPGHYTP